MRRRRPLETAVVSASTVPTAGCIAGYHGNVGALIRPKAPHRGRISRPARRDRTPIIEGIPAAVGPAFAADWSGLDSGGAEGPTTPP